RARKGATEPDIGWRGILGMRLKHTIGVVLTGLTAAAAFGGCNSLVGLDQFSITQGSGGSAGSSNPTTSGGTAGENPGTGGMGGQVWDGGDEPIVRECMTNKECTDRATAAALEAGAPDGSDGGPPGTVPAMCIQSIGKCVELYSPDCKTITGIENLMDDNAILLGTLFTTSGATGATNIQRQQSATLAFEEINAKGGLPPQTATGSRRKIIALSC